MAFRALLVTKDEHAARVLEPLLTGFGLTVERSPLADALALVSQQKFHIVLRDFEDPEDAAAIFETISGVRSDNHPISVALLSDREKVRHAFGAGANFVVFKPISAEQSEGALRAATALVKCERRGSFRVPIQIDMKLRLKAEQDVVEIEGILLDLSEHGMDVLASQPLYPSALINARFCLPNSPLEFALTGEVAWANPNGESGVQFSDTSEGLRAALACWVEENSQQSSRPKPEPLPGCTLTDLSPGGCYIETSSPFPERTLVTLALSTEGARLETPGLVRVMHPGHGMGIEFAMRTSAQREETSRFIQHLRELAGAHPELLVFPKTLAVSASGLSGIADEMEDPLFDLLRNHEAFSEETFLAALRSQRHAEVIHSDDQNYDPEQASALCPSAKPTQS